MHVKASSSYKKYFTKPLFLNISSKLAATYVLKWIGTSFDPTS